MQNKKILIIDDDADVISLLAKYLSGGGYDVISASNGIEGIQKTGSEKPDLILLDINMPDMNGHQVGIFLNNDFPDIPVMILTSETSKKDYFKAEISGVAGYLVKSLELNTIVDKINRFFNSKADNQT